MGVPASRGSRKGVLGLRGRAGACAALAAAAALGCPRPAQAQEITLKGPLGRAHDVFDVMTQAVAVRRDASVWLSLGGSGNLAPDEAAASFSGAGAQITHALAVTSGLLGVPSELRWGPWGQVWTDGVGARGEGGLAAQLYVYRRGFHVPVDVRLGGGYGDDALGRSPHLALTIAGGPRCIEGVPAFSELHARNGRLATPQLIAGWRLFVSGRRTVEPGAQYWVSAGVELELGLTAR
jgi:hypothetical protein